MQRLISGLGLAAALSLGCAAPLAEQAPSQPASPPAAQPAPDARVKLPNKNESVRFAVIGDAGTGGSAQLQVAKQLASFRSAFPFDFAIMLGDNLYGSERPADYKEKFEIPYKPLLDAGVKFYAALGNHDDPSQRMLQAVQHERRALLHVQDGQAVEAGQRERALLRARQQLRGRCAAGVHQEGAGRERIGLEDHVLPSSALLLG